MRCPRRQRRNNPTNLASPSWIPIDGGAGAGVERLSVRKAGFPAEAADGVTSGSSTGDQFWKWKKISRFSRHIFYRIFPLSCYSPFTSASPVEISFSYFYRAFSLFYFSSLFGWPASFKNPFLLLLPFPFLLLPSSIHLRLWLKRKVQLFSSKNSHHSCPKPPAYPISF